MTNFISYASGGFAKTATKSSVVSLVWQLIQLRQQRNALRDLDADRLQDLGISQQDAAQEAAKPLWDVPCHWQN